MDAAVKQQMQEAPGVRLCPPTRARSCSTWLSARRLQSLLRAVPGGEWAGPRASRRLAPAWPTNTPSAAGEAGGAGRAGC